MRVAKANVERPVWQTIVVVALALWLSGSLVIDLMMMPVLSVSGMLADPGFATAGYSMFWVFNRAEVLSAAIVLTGALVLYQTQRQKSAQFNQANVLRAALLLGIALAYTYGFTPQMSALGLQLNLFAPAEVPAQMNLLHLGYWGLEVLKLFAGVVLLKEMYVASMGSIAVADPSEVHV